MIEKTKLKFGSSPNLPNLEIETKPITIFVGPNNSGKSLILREFIHYVGSGQTQLILDGCEFSPVNDFEKQLERNFIVVGDDGNGNSMYRPKNITHISGGRSWIEGLLNTPNNFTHDFCQNYLRWQTLLLDGTSRLQMINNQRMGDLLNPNTVVSKLFADDEKRLQVRNIIYEAFSEYFVISPINDGQLEIGFSNQNPLPALERSLSQESVEFHRNNTVIHQKSDGVKAFTGIIITLIADDPKIILLDEPEAFLHPSLSFKLGKEIGNILKTDQDKRLFVATHSANFLMGCIQSGVPVNIVRLTYSNKVPTARLLPSEKISKLIRHPLLRSVGTLNGLYYEYVIVTESDSDRAFYQEINERLLQFSPERGIPNCLFLNAQNKQTIHEIIKPLREMGVPCVGIADIDVIKEGGANWSNFTNCGFLPEVTRQETETARNRIKAKFDEKGIDFKRNGGVDVLNTADKEACNNLFERLEEYGIFVVRNGELESWLKPLGATGHSPKWLIEIFEKMGEDLNSADYIKPSNDDVWEFIGRIKNWFTNPNRKGIPD